MNAQTMDTFLTPIEKPHGLTLKLAYFFMRKQFRKVLTPMKVIMQALLKMVKLDIKKLKQSCRVKK